MSGAGRPSKPSKLKVLHGTDRKDRMNENEPEPMEFKKAPEPPHYLDYYAKKEWKRAAPVLIESRLLTKADLSLFQDYCSIHAHCVRLNKKLSGPNAEYDFVTESGYQQKRPVVSILQDFIKLKEKLANQLGLSPSARTDIEVDKPKGNKTSREDILNGEVG